MPGRLRSLHSHLNAYHHNVSLLFQFILSEFLTVHKEAQQLSAMAHTPRASKVHCEAFLEPLGKLAGGTQDYMRFFAGNLEYGLLSKLKNYCALYAQNQIAEPTTPHSKRIAVLQQHANQAWLLCMQCLDLLRAIKEGGRNAKISEMLAKVAAKLLATLSRIAKVLESLIVSFQNDENVLFFLLRHTAELEAVYGAGFVAKIFAKMHPEGTEAFEQLLIERYSKRGFDHLLPIIKAKIAQLQ